MRIVCISDTHTYGPRIVVPEGDVLVHTGDHTFRGTTKEVKKALAWLESLPHKVKLLIAGNHDFFFDPKAPRRFRSWSLYKPYGVKKMMAKFPSLTYLCDEPVFVGGKLFYGSPWVPYIPSEHDGSTWAFNFTGGEAGHGQAKNTWAKIPDDVEVLLTHTPPKGIRDSGWHEGGCPWLRKRLDDLPKLRLHVFGHLHGGYGQTDYRTVDGEELTFVNAAINNDNYEPRNPPIVVDI